MPLAIFARAFFVPTFESTIDTNKVHPLLDLGYYRKEVNFRKISNHPTKF